MLKKLILLCETKIEIPTLYRVGSSTAAPRPVEVINHSMYVFDFSCIPVAYVSVISVVLSGYKCDLFFNWCADKRGQIPILSIHMHYCKQKQDLVNAFILVTTCRLHSTCVLHCYYYRKKGTHFPPTRKLFLHLLQRPTASSW